MIFFYYLRIRDLSWTTGSTATRSPETSTGAGIGQVTSRGTGRLILGGIHRIVAGEPKRKVS